VISLCILIAAVAAPVEPQRTATQARFQWEGADIRLLANSADTQPTAGPAATSRPSLRNDPRAIRWRKTIFWSAILIFILIVASIAIVRFSRRYAAYLRDKPAAPTASDDVWAMHRLPPDPATDTTSDEPEEGPDELPDQDDVDDEPQR